MNDFTMNASRLNQPKIIIQDSETQEEITFENVDELIAFMQKAKGLVNLVIELVGALEKCYQGLSPGMQSIVTFDGVLAKAKEVLGDG